MHFRSWNIFLRSPSLLLYFCTFWDTTIILAEPYYALEYLPHKTFCPAFFFFLIFYHFFRKTVEYNSIFCTLLSLMGSSLQCLDHCLRQWLSHCRGWLRICGGIMSSRGWNRGQGLPWEIRPISITLYSRKSAQNYIKQNARVDLVPFSFLKAEVILFESILLKYIQY